MLKMILLSAVLLSGPAHEHPTTNGKKPSTSTKRAASFRLPSLHTGRCSGGANCRACSNCNYCGHCAGGGGTCSVCANYSTPAPTHSRSYSGNRSYGGSRSTGTTSTRPTVTLEVTGDYYVAATTLNLRAEPSADAAVVRVLDRNDVVTVAELTNAKWAKVTVSTTDGEVEGYLSRAYLSVSPSY